MKQIISVSRRADVIAQSYDWLVGVVKQGKVQLQNPYFPKQKYWVSLREDDVHSFVFWSRDYQAFIENTAPFDPFSLFFQYTINNYADYLENVPPLSHHLEQAKVLIERYGTGRFTWRFAPVIFLNDGLGLHHSFRMRLEAFIAVAEGLRKITQERLKVVTSYIDFVPITQKNLQKYNIGYYQPTEQEIQSFFRELAKIAVSFKFELQSCAEDNRFSHIGISNKPCIDGREITAMTGMRASYAKAVGQRPLCQCTKNVDIGIYPFLDGGIKCINQCKYCYVKGAT